MESINALNLTGLPKIFFGAGAISQLPEIIASHGRQALIITGGESFKNSGVWGALTMQLNRAQIRCKAISVRGEPAAAAIDAIAREYRQTAVTVVVAIGGGSVIDCGKAVAAMLAETGFVKDYLEGIGTKKPSGAKVPFIAVPTTAGTGSEATNNAVLCDRKEGYKKSLRHDAYVPDVALVDPRLTLTLPPPLTVACGLDAVAQLIESYTSTKADETMDAAALKALSFAIESLPLLALDRGNDLALREKMSYAALVSGITLNRAGLGVVHGIAGPLGGLCPVPHGVACGKLLFPVMSFVVKKVIDEKNLAAQKRFADIGRIFAKTEDQDDPFYCRQLLDALHQWTQTLKLPQLSGFGMTAALMAQTVALADSKNSPARLSPKEIKVILETVR